MRGISASHLAYVNVFAVRRPDRLPGWRLTVLVARWQLIARVSCDDCNLPDIGNVEGDWCELPGAV
jgi:hypothetical protein